MGTEIIYSYVCDGVSQCLLSAAAFASHIRVPFVQVLRVVASVFAGPASDLSVPVIPEADPASFPGRNTARSLITAEPFVDPPLSLGATSGTKLSRSCEIGRKRGDLLVS